MKAPSETGLEYANELYRRGEYDSLRTFLEPALEVATDASDTASQSRILTLLGSAAYREGDYATARRLSERALSLKLAIGLETEYSRSYNALGLIAWAQSRLSEALEFFDRAAEAAVTDTVRARAVAAINRGLVASDWGDFRTARRELERGVELSRATDDARLQALALNNLGMLDTWTGNPVSALGHLAEAEDRYRAAAVADLPINAMGQRGVALTSIGDFDRAIAVLDSAIELARDRGLRHEEASNIETLAETYRSLGDHQRALELYAAAETFNAELNPQASGSNLRRRAEIFADLGEIGAAIELAERALATHRAGDARWEQLADLVLLAELTSMQGDPERSRQFLSASSDLADAFETRVARVYTSLAAARIAERAGDPRRVLEVLGPVQEDLSSVGYDPESEGHLLRARALFALGRAESAAAAGAAAVRAVERVRRGLESAALHTAFAHQRGDVYATQIRILLSMGRTEEAFEVAARSHGRALLQGRADPVSERRDAPDGELAPAEGELLLRQVLKLEAGLRDLAMLPPTERDPEAVAALQALRDEARRRYEDVDRRMNEEPPAIATLAGSRVPTAAEIAESLRPDEALLLPLVSEDRGVGFLVRRDRIASFELPTDETSLANGVRVVRDLLGRPGAGDNAVRPALRGLHDLIIGPAADAGHLDGVERLTVIPTGVLAYLPIGALIDPDGRYLAERFLISAVPSAAVLPAVRSSRGTVDPGAGSSVSFAPYPDRLPASREEAETVADLLGRGVSVVGRRATEAAFRAALSEASIVHVASHGELNPANPLFSVIEFRPGSSGSREDDGSFEVDEALGISIRSALVFLSGCETGLGRAWSTQFDRGEDYATLALAFLHAGARNVIATLWRVEDRAAAAFATRFYQELRVGDATLALARAQRAFIENPDFSHPFFWAGYRLVGGGGRTTASAVR